MAAPFEPQPVPGRSLLERLFRLGPPVAAAEAEILNRFAGASSIRDVDDALLVDIQKRYGFDPRIALVPLLETIFRRYFSFCVGDQQLSDGEVEDLVHLKRLFGMPDAVAREIHDEIAGRRFDTAIEERLAANGPSQETLDFLERLRDRLLLSDRYVANLRRQIAESIMQEAEQRAVTDHALSPDEARELIALAESLDVEWPASESDALVLDRMRDYWSITNTPLPVIDTDLPLRAGEQLHLHAPESEWFAVARVSHLVDRRTERSSFAQDSLQLFNADPRDTVFSQQVRTSDALTPVDTGALFLTNQRLRFRGRHSERRIEFADILAIEERDGQIWLTVPDGRRTVLALAADTDLAYLMLARLLREAPSPTKSVAPERRLSLPNALSRRP